MVFIPSSMGGIIAPLQLILSAGVFKKKTHQGYYSNYIVKLLKKSTETEIVNLVEP